MVTADINDQTQTGQIILTPNASWSWKANLYLLYTLAGLSLSIGIGFMMLGAWVVLPYSILELLALTGCIYYCVLQCNRQEVIIVNEHEVRIQKGFRRPVETSNYHRLWAKFVVKAPRHPWDTEVISIASHGKEQELGSFLNQQDKSLLISQLKRVVPH